MYSFIFTASIVFNYKHLLSTPNYNIYKKQFSLMSVILKKSPVLASNITISGAAATEKRPWMHYATPMHTQS